MASAVVVVESPAKGKTIEKYLGKDYKVFASYGHVMDIAAKTGSVDPDNNFAMKYVEVERNTKHVDAIAKALKKADTLLLATDPDREGEAIAYHINELLQEKGLLEGKTTKRVVFYEITKKAVKAAVTEGRELSMDLVRAQKARRALDYLVGFNLSPLLWKKVKPSLSAGRVQSPALRMIVEREDKIKEFVSREYWTIEADLTKSRKKFSAKLNNFDEEKLKQFSITSDVDANGVKDKIEKGAAGELEVTNIEKKTRKRNPAAPFTTSTLQQEASRKLGFGAQRTMRVAQQLYEGIEADDGTQGLITYMRTDSVNMAKEAVEEIRVHVEQEYGVDCVPSSPRVFKTKSKNAQEAHEAIRPTMPSKTPAQLKTYLNRDQYKLYELIWKRAVASQMVHATLDTVAIDLSCSPKAVFRANGSVVRIPGFMQLYQEDKDDAKQDDDKQKILPPMEIGDKVKLNLVRAEQHFTEPPPRYTEASLVKELEENGIGRPSTYASIIGTLQHRKYVVLESKRFMPTDVGEVVSKFLTNYFTKYVDYGFTASLEDELDGVSRGEKEMIPLLEDFWKPFIELINDVQENVSKKDVTQEETDEECPECKKKLSIRLGRNGKFIGCTGYPECSYTRNIDSDGTETETTEPEVVADRKCPGCESDLHIKLGRYGKFIGCSSYPKCKHMEPLEKPEETDVECPECKSNKLLKKKSRYGKYFYSCGSYPKCKYAVWNPPLNQNCPTCNWPVLTVKTTKRKGEEIVCPQKECDYIEPYKK